MANKNLSNAKNAKNDEFYTQLNDIQAEVNAYIDYDPDVFRGKTVLLPCDDPEWSNFTRFFAQNFERFGLKKLISTSYAAASKKIPNAESQSRGVRRGGRGVSPTRPQWYQPTLFEQESPQYDEKKTAVKGKIFVLDHDTNANGKIDFEDLEWEYLEGDGDFRSEEVCKLRDEADMIITNPPFSLFREFLAWIVGDGFLTGFTGLTRLNNCGSYNPVNHVNPGKEEKKFLIIGNKNCITYKEVFPLIKENKIWTGCRGFAGGMWFISDYEGKTEKIVDGKKIINVPSIWFTNLEHGRRHQPLRLMKMADNIKFSKHKEVRGKGYLRYDNYDAIEVPFTDAIPSDYDGVMGVPKSFVDKYCPEQFEIVGCAEGESGKELGLAPFDRELKRLNPSLRDGQLYYMQDGVPVKPFARILIRHRR